ncbi:MAG: S-layer homology domain-containing protein [Peptococcaceae bacterium]
MPITDPGRTFKDISFHKDRTAIEALAARRIMSGRSTDLFEPEAAMTRAEFAAVMVKTLGLPAKKTVVVLADVPTDSRYAGAVSTAYEYGLLGGAGDASSFNPGDLIIRQEAAVIVTCAAGLCGLETAIDSGEVRDLPAPFPDYVTAADWARASLALCYREDILSRDDLNIRPQEPIKRCETAQMLFQLLGAANLI